MIQTDELSMLDNPPGEEMKTLAASKQDQGSHEHFEGEYTTTPCTPADIYAAEAVSDQVAANSEEGEGAGVNVAASAQAVPQSPAVSKTASAVPEKRNSILERKQMETAPISIPPMKCIIMSYHQNSQ